MSICRITRRGALGMLASAPLLSLAGTSARAAGGEIKVLNWQGYGTDEKWALDAFKKATGITVTHDYFNSEQEMLTKLRTSPGVYDVVLCNNIYVMQAAQEGLIQPLDTSKISNFADLTPALRDSDRFVKDGKHWALSWVWGLTSFAYNSDKITDKIDSLEALWDAKYAGKVGMRDDAMEAIQIGALATGQDMNNPADMDKIKAKLLALKTQLKTFWSSEDEWNKLFAAGDYLIAIYWSGSAARSKKAMKLPVQFVVPKEGAIGWFDGLTVAANAPNPDGAHAFINYMVDPSFYVPWDNNIGAPASANTKAIAQLPPDALNRAVLGDPEVVKRVQWMAPADDAKRQKLQEVWDEIKTAFAK